MIYFFDHDNKAGITLFFFLTVSNVILDCFSNCRLYFINNKKKVPTITVIVLLMNTPRLTLITDHNISLPSIPVLAFFNAASTTSHLIQFCAMNIQYYVFRHSHPLLNQNQVYVPILLTKHREEVLFRTCVIQYQDIYNNILIINWSNGLFTALFWNFLAQQIVYH